MSSKDDSGTNATDRCRPESDLHIFCDGERLLAYYDHRFYEAKVQKTEIGKREQRYFIHYLGWNKMWDEWVGADRLIKYTEENILKLESFDKKQGVDKNPASGWPSETKPKPSSDVEVIQEDVKSKGAKGKKRKNDSSIDKESASIEKPVKIQIPPSLKKQLVEDWEFINQQDKLVKLPRSPSVDGILRRYLVYRSKKDGMITDEVGEILRGIRCYFDKALLVVLLYDTERQQYHESVVGDTSPSTIYGAEHLLRLFVKLPEFLRYVNIAEDLVTVMQSILVDLLKFIHKNRSSFFLSAYTGNDSDIDM